MSNSFGTAINCIDGRAQAPVREWMIEHLGVDYVDRLTVPGPDRVLTEGTRAAEIAALQEQAEISITRHDSQVIVVAGHHDCAGNPVDAETHKRQIRHSVEQVAQWGWPVRVIGLWVNEAWEAELVCEQMAEAAR